MNPILFLIGDSISVQYSPFLREFLEPEWECRLPSGREEALANLDIAVGANGGDSHRLLSLVREIVKSEAPAGSIFAFNCGLHDIRRDRETKALQVPLEDYTNNLRSMADLLKDSAWQPVWITTTPVDDHTHNVANYFTTLRFREDEQTYRRASISLMEEHGIPVCDFGSFTARLGLEAFCDHVHYHPDVQRLQATFLAGWLQSHRRHLDLVPC
jgi:lysophospholipase L1-like esterase